MRYRRYYSQSNRDGSRTVVSVGPIGSLWVSFVKCAVILVVLGWPIAVVRDNVHSPVWDWVLGLPFELLWLVVLLAIWRASQKPTPKPASRPRSSTVVRNGTKVAGAQPLSSSRLAAAPTPPRRTGLPGARSVQIVKCAFCGISSPGSRCENCGAPR